MIAANTAHITKVQIAKPEFPASMGCGKAQQPFNYYRFLRTKLQSVVVTRLAHSRAQAGKSNAYAPTSNNIFSHNLNVVMASLLFLNDFLADLSLELFLTVHLVEPTILILQLFRPIHQRGVYAAELRSPPVKCCTGNAMLAAQLWNWDTRASACLRMVRIGLSEYGDFFIDNSLC